MLLMLMTDQQRFDCFQAAASDATGSVQGRFPVESRVDLVALQPLYLYPLSPMANDTAPATIADLNALKADLRGEIAAVKNELLLAITTAKDDMRAEMVSMKTDIMRHFDVVAEKLYHDLLGGHRDQIEILKDHDTDHARRIRRLEDHAGLIA